MQKCTGTDHQDLILSFQEMIVLDLLCALNIATVCPISANYESIHSQKLQ
jgi:hypothetical protein